MKKALGEVIDIGIKRNVRKGPELWISKLLH
jgi:hypothetical protein